MVFTFSRRTGRKPLRPVVWVWFWKGHCSTAANQNGANSMTVFLLHTKSWPRIRQLRKLHLSSLFDRLALGYWHENFADWYETKGKSIFFSHAGFESRVMRFSGPKSPWSRNRSKSNSPPLSFFLHYSNRQTQNSPNRSDLPLRGTQKKKYTR